MDTYIRDLKKKSPSHKRRFAIMVSGVVTLIIFVTWSFVTFGSVEIAKENTGPVQLAAVAEADGAFFKDIFSAMGDTLSNLTTLFSNGR